jgi:hypothetical protein
LRLWRPDVDIPHQFKILDPKTGMQIAKGNVGVVQALLTRTLHKDRDLHRPRAANARFHWLTPRKAGVMTLGYRPSTPISFVRADPAAKAIVDRYVPGALDSSMVQHLRRVSLQAIVENPILGSLSQAQVTALWDELAALPGGAIGLAPEPGAIQPRTDYESQQRH